MASMHPSTLFRPGLPPHCTPTTGFLERASIYFGICMPTPLGFISTTLGGLSIVSWLFAQMPQVYKNYQLQSAAGLSVYFLLEWLLGDLSNLLGAIFTEQAGWQVILASYYVFVDTCLVYQYFWYTYGLPKWRGEVDYSSGSDTDDDANSELINSLSPINSSFADERTEYFKRRDDEQSKNQHTQPINTPHFTTVNYEKASIGPQLSVNQGQWPGSSWAGPSPRTMMYAATVSTLMSQARAAPVGANNILFVMEGKTRLQFAGTIISWCSTILYLGSRLPQLYKNWRRRSTAGLSPVLFFAAFCGNLFYSSSMLTNPNAWYNYGPYGGHGWADEHGSERGPWIANAAPFFLGAFVVLFLDATMGVQFLMYGEKRDKLVKVRGPDGYSRWQRVSGWMRGWIPTISKEKIVDLAESQRLLSESRELDRHLHQSRYGGI